MNKLVDNQIVKNIPLWINGKPAQAVSTRAGDVTNPATLPKRQIEAIILPPLAATMDDCCRIAEMLPAPSGETPLTIAILSIASPLELSVSAVYTANPLNGDGISIDVEYIPSRRLVIGGAG